MILNYNQMQSNPEFGSGVFFGKVMESPEQSWVSTLPTDMEMVLARTQSDPTSMLMGLTNDEFQFFMAGGDINEQSFLVFARGWANQILYNVVTSTRQMFGMLTRTVGMLSDRFGMLRGIFEEEASIAMRVLNIVEGIVESEMFEMMLNAIGAIPVVGWIIKAVVEVAKAVTSIVGMFMDQGQALAISAAASQLTIPMDGVEFSKDADDRLTREIFDRMRNGVQQSFITPAYNPLSEGVFQNFTAEGVYKSGWKTQNVKGGGEDTKGGMGWVIFPGTTTGGMGFVPGTGNLTRTLFLPAALSSSPNSPTRGCATGAVRDLGSLYPTASGLMNSWWSSVLEEGPAMFSVDPLATTDMWEDYVHSMLVLGENVLKGWTCAPTGVPFTNKFWCIESAMGYGNKRDPGLGNCEWNRRGESYQPAVLPSDFGLDPHLVFMSYVYQLYFGLVKLSDRDKYYDPSKGEGIPLLGSPAFYEDIRKRLWADPDSVNVAEAIPLRALRNLHARQVATLQSPHCMYVNGEDTTRFPAFQNGALKTQWEQSVTAILNSSDWRRVKPVDVPEGPAKAALYQRIQGADLDPETFNAPCPPGAPPSHPCRQMGVAMGPSVLGDPTPPAPPPMNDVDVQQFALPDTLPPPRRPGSKKKARAAGGGGMVLAAAALAAFFMMKK